MIATMMFTYGLIATASCSYLIKTYGSDEYVNIIAMKNAHIWAIAVHHVVIKSGYTLSMEIY